MRGSIRQKGNTYYIRYYENGKQIEKKAGSTKAEAKKKLTEIMYKLDTGYVISTSMLLKDYLDMWVKDYIELEKSTNTADKYSKVIVKYITPSIGDIKLNELKVIHIEKFLRDLKRHKEPSGKKLSATSIQNYYGILRAALNKAVKLQMLNDNPCRFVDTPKRNKFKANTLDIHEFKSIYSLLDLDNYEDYIFSLGLDLDLETGFRRGEMCGLTWSDIDLNNKTITLNQALIREENIYTISDLKTDSSYRTIPISDTLVSKLRKHKQIQNLNKLKYGPLYKKNIFNGIEYDLVYTWENGGFIIPSNFLQRLKRLMKRCNINKNIRWHDLRHTNATLLLEGGANMKTVQERLGHSLMQTTSDTYAHVTEKMNREATDIITNILNIN